MIYHNGLSENLEKQMLIIIFTFFPLLFHPAAPLPLPELRPSQHRIWRLSAPQMRATFSSASKPRASKLLGEYILVVPGVSTSACRSISIFETNLVFVFVTAYLSHVIHSYHVISVGHYFFFTFRRRFSLSRW